MGILDFSKPKKIRPTDEHNKMHQSDSGVAGTYVPNMSQEDDEKWKAKHIKGNYERIEIRKNTGGSNMVIVVNKKDPAPSPTYFDYWTGPDKKFDDEAYQDDRKEYQMLRDNIKISANGPIWLSFELNVEMQQAINEAVIILFKTKENE